MPHLTIRIYTIPKVHEELVIAKDMEMACQMAASLAIEWKSNVFFNSSNSETTYFVSQTDAKKVNNLT